MKPIYSGFDGLEFAVQVTIPLSLADALAAIKANAQEFDSSLLLEMGGVWLTVNKNGVSGGYAYSCTEDTTGNWFFKKPSLRDPWGVRFSAASSAIAILGIEGLRLRCAEVLDALGINAPVESYSPSRVDFAIDFLAPEFAVVPDKFVIHSRAGLKSIDLIEDMQINGRSNRTTSVTVGKMPNRQAIIYDKREEVIVKRKHEWPAIWGRAMNGPDAPPLDISDSNTSRVWRVELRVAKRHLKDVWDINSWASLYELLQRVFMKMLDDINYCQPCTDTNRSRWRNHAIWTAVRDTVANDLFTDIPTLSPEEYVEIKKDQKIDELTIQALGLAISVAAIQGCTADNFDDFVERFCCTLEDKSTDPHRPLHERLIKAHDKYRYLVS